MDEKLIKEQESIKDWTPKVLTDPLRRQMTAVLNEFVKVGVIGIAFDHCGIERRLHRVWKELYPEYEQMFNTMNDRLVDGLESVAIERAKEKSDSLMILLLKANRPEKYNLTTDVNVNSKNNIKFIFPEGMLSAEERKLLGGNPDEE